MAKIDYGIEEIVFAPLAADGKFPDFETSPGKVSIQMIDIDSVELQEDENSTVALEFENSDTLTLSGTKGAKRIVFTTSDKDDAIAKAFKGMKVGVAGEGNDGWNVEDPNQDDSSTWAMRIRTKALGSYPAKIKEYTPVLVVVKESGSIGKNNIGKYSFTCTRQPNFNASGNKIGGFREKSVLSV